MCPPGQLVAVVRDVDVVADQNIEKGGFPVFGIMNGRLIFNFTPGFPIIKYHYWGDDKELRKAHISFIKMSASAVYVLDLKGKVSNGRQLVAKLMLA